MTKHNLNQNLAWLLQQHTHSHNRELEYTLIALPDSVSLEPSTDVPYPIAHSITGEANFQGRIPQDQRLSSLAVVGNGLQDTTSDMARLQLAPQIANKPKLITQAKPPHPLPSPAPSRSPLVERPTSQYNARDLFITPQAPRARATVRTPATLYEDSVFDDASNIFDIDEIDLTTGDVTTSSFEDFGPPTRLWREDSASRVEPLPNKRGKKRKSDEHQDDLLSPRASQTSRKHRTASQAKGQRFDLNAIPQHSASVNRPVAPEQRVRQTPKKNRHLPNEGNGLATHDVQYEEELSITETTVRTETRRSRPSAQRQIDEGSDARRPPPTSPVKLLPGASHRKRRSTTVVPDSDEDEEQDKPERNIPIVKHEGSPPKGVDFDHVIDRSETNATPSPLKPKLRTDSEQGMVPMTLPEPKISESPLQIEQSARTPNYPSSGTSAMTGQRTGKLSQHERDTLKRFIERPASHCCDLLDMLTLMKDSTGKEWARQMCEEDEVSADLKEKSKLINTRIKAITELQAQTASYVEQIEKRTAIQSRLHELFASGIEPDESDLNSEMSQLSSRARNVKMEIEKTEVSLFELYQQAGLSAGWSDEHPIGSLGPSTLLETPHRPSRNILVASTQNSRRDNPIQGVSNTFQDSVSALRACSTAQTPPALRFVERNTSSRMSRDPMVSNKRHADTTERVRESPKHPTRRQFENLGHVPTFPRALAPADGPVALSPSRADREKPTTERRYASVVDEDSGFTRNMGSPPQTFSVADDFDDDLNDEGAFLDIAEAFEQRLHPPNRDASIGPARRPVLSEMNQNVRREKSSRPTSQGDVPSAAAQKQYPWSRDATTALRQRFHLRGFRHNQLEAINATLGGKDAFVLMPTGGGKSLCYQLPSIVQSGKTRGVTVVISPLLSLMQDQVDHLQKLQIQACLINSEVSAEHRKFVFSALRGPTVERFIQLLYVTPEMLSKSQAITDVFRYLHERQRLARIVIDEAHCVSQWGHDFRPDYKALGEVRKQFPGVPVMALTATATENVKLDVIHSLGMDGCDVFTQSFNRPNLSYEVRPKPKGKATLDDIANTIHTLYRGQSGIIYCLSRKSCEQIATQLDDDYQIKAKHYHAGMEPQERIDVQKKWQAGQYHVIVATIAFGMGIDKPDVRFVIHHTIPKSLEGYYQETGRAGRDGKQSGCYLYYGYGDTSSLKRMIKDGEGSYEQKERQRQMLRNMVQFCENRSDCRRVQVLNYFNERFSSEDCNEGCDNCSSATTFEMQDFTDHAQAATRLVKQVQKDDVTLLHCVDVYRGSKIKKIVDAKHHELEEHGRGAKLERGDIERLFYNLLSEDALEELNVMKMGFPQSYIKLGPRWREYDSGRKALRIPIRISPKGKSKPKPKSKAPRQQSVLDMGPPASTNVSSPLQARSKRRPARRKPPMNPVFDEDDQDEDDQDDASDIVEFAEIRERGVPVADRRREAGPPIAIDQKLAKITNAHRRAIEYFVKQAKKSLSSIVISKSLKRQPISDTVLREIALVLPLCEDDLLDIDGMDEEKFKIYGQLLLKHSQDAWNFLDSLEKEPITIDDDELNEDEETFQESDEIDEPDEDDETSEYFSAVPDSEVSRFNAKLSHIPTHAPTSRSKKVAARSRSSGSGISRGVRGSSRGGVAAGGRYRKKTAGVTKKKRPASTGTSNGSGSGGSFFVSKKRSGPSSKSSRGAGIGMMPT